MRRFLFISSGILFICIAAALVIIGAGEKDNILLMLAGMAIPFLFVGFWNIYNVFYEKKINYADEYFTYKSNFSLPVSAVSPRKSSGLDLQGDTAETSVKSGFTVFGIGAFYNKKIIVPVFIILFTTVSLAIVNSFLASSKSTEDIAIAVLIFSFIFSLSCTIYFLVKIKNEVNEAVSSKSEIDDIGLKVAFFFASVATGGLFAIGWLIYKKLKKSTSE